MLKVYFFFGKRITGLFLNFLREGTLYSRGSGLFYLFALSKDSLCSKWLVRDEWNLLLKLNTVVPCIALLLKSSHHRDGYCYPPVSSPPTIDLNYEYIDYSKTFNFIFKSQTTCLKAKYSSASSDGYKCPEKPDLTPGGKDLPREDCVML